MNEVETKDVGTTDLSAYMMKVIEELRRDRKPPAVHIYACTLRSFNHFHHVGRQIRCAHIFCFYFIHKSALLVFYAIYERTIFRKECLKDYYSNLNEKLNI